VRRVLRSFNRSGSGATEQTLLESGIAPGMPRDHHAERDDYIEMSQYYREAGLSDICNSRMHSAEPHSALR
jgi:hypothetical protein